MKNPAGDAPTIPETATHKTINKVADNIFAIAFAFLPAHRRSRRKLPTPGATQSGRRRAGLGKLPGNNPLPLPETAREPFYSTWYSYRHNVFSGGTRRAIRDEADYSRRRMVCRRRQVRLRLPERRQSSQAPGPDMRAHVENVHKLGMKVRGAVRLFQRSVRALQGETSERCEKSGLRVARPALSRGARISD